MTFEEKVREAAVEIFNIIGVDATTKYMRSGGGEAVAGMVTSRSGVLSRSLLNGAGSINEVVMTGDGAILRKGTTVPYAALHELGGIRAVTTNMRRFFLFKFFQTGDPKWKAMSRASQLFYPARPFLTPAVYNNVPQIKDILERKIGEFLKFTITRIITGQQRAEPITLG